jgi:glyoxylase-like metal-dependent hydrolase (beta-lactamase superfamily II)
MRTALHGKYLIQLTRYTAFNCQLVREEDGFTLIDTGLPGSAAAILEALRKLGAPIQRIALTHAHIDHVGSLDALHEQLPAIPVAIGARDARFLRGDRSLDPDEPQDKPRGGYVVCKTIPTRLLQPGDHVGSLEVIATPGHTPGHISFFDPRDGTVIAGDAFTTKGGITTAGTLNWLFPLTAMAYWHKPTAIRSAKALCAMQPRQLAVGHGIVLTDPVPAMERAIAEAERRVGTASLDSKRIND